jgi:hypothetical protein
MIVHNLNVMSAIGTPDKADTPLIVYADTVLTGPIAAQGFQSVSWRQPQITQAMSRVQLFELSARDPLNRLPATYRLPIKEGPGIAAAK